VNVIGFGPTLYFRPFFDVPKIPLYLYAHGVVGTGWFVLVLAQALLIGRRRFRVHRQLGWFGVCLAAVVLALGVYTSTNLVPRHAALGAVGDADVRLYGFVTQGDLASFVNFPTLLALAIVFRRSVDVHMRLMLLAALSILGPAAARIASWFGEIPNPVIPVVLFGFLARMVIHDFRSRGRFHPATTFGALWLVVVALVLRLSGIAPAIVAHRLGHV